MKTPTFCFVLCLALAACGGSDKDTPPATKTKPDQVSENSTPATTGDEGAGKPPTTTPKKLQKGNPQPQTRVVDASDKAKQAAIDRVAIMREITAVLKPLRDPEAALAKEKVLDGLFTEYNRLGQVAIDDGLTPRLLAILTSQVAPDEWRDVRAEFQQYLLLVRQLGEPQKEMMDRVMEADRPEPAEDAAEIQGELEKMTTPTPDPGGTPPQRQRRPRDQSE